MYGGSYDLLALSTLFAREVASRFSPALIALHRNVPIRFATRDPQSRFPEPRRA